MLKDKRRGRTKDKLLWTKMKLALDGVLNGWFIICITFKE
jgi:hypothetical protein